MENPLEVLDGIYRKTRAEMSMDWFILVFVWLRFSRILLDVFMG